MVASSTAPKVSVCVITFNQKDYIAQCLQSILDQVTDFDFELIVGDDCSTDGTREIVRQFEADYPGIVKPIYQSRNIGGGSHNFATVHQAAIGQYVAHVDGDDYCLPGKLQAQVDVLDADPNCTVVFHRMTVLWPDGQMSEGPLEHVQGLADMRFDRGALVEYMAVGYHSSKMYRRSSVPLEIPDFGLIDYYVNVEQVGSGHARFSGHDLLGVYRIGGGIASSGPGSRVALAASIVHFSRKYPKLRLQANTAALTCALADIKNRRGTWRIYAMAWIRTFDIRSPWRLFRAFEFVRQFGARKPAPSK